MRNWLGVFLCLVLLAAMAVPVLAQDTADVVISDTETFLAFAENCRLDSYSVGLTVRLTADIDLSGVAFTGVPIFCGTFLGDGHRISGLELTVDGSDQGCFRYLTKSAVVRDLHIIGKVQPGGSAASVGGIAGRNAGVIKNCSVTGTVSGSSQVGGIAGCNEVSGLIDGCRTSGEIFGKHLVGGITGGNYGVVQNCENTASVNVTPQQNSVDLSGVTIETITGSESVNTVTDIGGIAGLSDGVIRNSRNLGNVGYKHMGYNVGGISGIQTGYISGCENYGAVSGRKEVGGLVGQMEPAITLRYEADTLQILQGQMAVLGDLTDRAALNAQTNTQTVKELVWQLESHTANAEKAMDVLTTLPEDLTEFQWDTYTAALQTLNSSVSGIHTTSRSLYQAVKETGEDLESDLRAIMDLVEVINETLNTGEQNLGGTVTDVSDRDMPQDLSSKLEASQNFGAVLGDWNVGGIVGAMALENDLDPESDITVSGETTLNAAGSVRSVVLACINNGQVTTVKKNAGGVVGWQSLGLIKDCCSTMAVTGQSYTGGIAGQSLGYIRACYAKGRIRADAFAGGIAGSGTVVTDSYSIVQLSGRENVGAVLGHMERNHTDVVQPVLGNYYVCATPDPGAIDGISYAQLAQPITLEAFLALETVPEQIKTVTVSFRFPDGSVQEISLKAGGSIKKDQIPQVPQKEGCWGTWEGLDTTQLDQILLDRVYEVVYSGNSTTIATAENRDGKPVLLALGNFSPAAAVVLHSGDTLFPVLTYAHSVLEQVTFSVSEAEQVTGLRYLLPEDTAREGLRLYLCSEDGSWREISFSAEGSYLAFAAKSSDRAFTLVREAQKPFPWPLIAVVSAVVLLGVGVALFICRRRKKTKSIPRQQVRERQANESS